MPSNQFLTLKDVTALDALNHPSAIPLVDNIVNVAPELDRILGRPIQGISYPASIMTGIGSNAGFRRAGSGVPFSAPSFDEKTFKCMPWDCQMSVDEAYLIERRALAGESPAQVFTAHMTAANRQKAIMLGRQFWQGAAIDPLGPMGAIDYLMIQRTMPDSRTGQKIDQAVNALGNSANCEIVWFIKQGPDGMHWLWGNGRGIIANPWIRLPGQPSPDSTNASPKYSTQWKSNVFGYIGTSMAQVHAVGAVYNVDATQTGTTNGIPTFAAGLTDAMTGIMWGKWPITMKPDLCFASQRAIVSLQMSRSVTNFVNSSQRDWTKDAAPIADFPTHLPLCGGIPIIPTDSINLTGFLTLP